MGGPFFGTSVFQNTLQIDRASKISKFLGGMPPPPPIPSQPIIGPLFAFALAPSNPHGGLVQVIAIEILKIGW